MPKPILHKGGQLIDGPSALRARPELAALMMDIIILWSVLEQHISMMFATLLHGRIDDSIEIYHAFFDIAPRKRIFDTMAETRLSGPLKAEIEEFFKSLRKTGKLRNLIAHNLWGASPLYPDCLLLEDSKHAIKRMLKGVTDALDPTKHRNEIDRDIHAGMQLQRYYAADFIAGRKAINEKSRESLELGLKITTELMQATLKSRVARKPPRQGA